MSGNSIVGKVVLRQGGIDIDVGSDDPKSVLDTVKRKVSDLMNMKGVNFLLGAGGSAEAIPDMKKMKQEVEERLKRFPDEQIYNNAKNIYHRLARNNIGLEAILGALYSKRKFLEASGQPGEPTEKLIKTIEGVIYKSINIKMSSGPADRCLEVYRRFYQKLALRSLDLHRLCVFTTNNDLMNETALDYLNINYNDGFGGGITRYFNPARFSFALSRKIDQAYEKYEPIASLVNLFKLHGSINWIESEGNAFFNISQIHLQGGEEAPEKNVLIYPNPLKQNASLGSPYVDLIREFQNRLLKPHGVLFVIGYSFSDEHINNAIYQALAANSSLSVVVFGEYPHAPICNSLDRRVYNIFGEIEEPDGRKKKVHYFEYIVDQFVPDQDKNKDDELLKGFVDFVKRFEVREGEGG